MGAISCQGNSRRACAHAPRRIGTVTIVGGDEAECRRRLQEIEAAGEQIGHVRFIVTGVTRAESRPVPVDVGPRLTCA